MSSCALASSPGHSRPPQARGHLLGHTAAHHEVGGEPDRKPQRGQRFGLDDEEQDELLTSAFGVLDDLHERVGRPAALEDDGVDLALGERRLQLVGVRLEDRRRRGPAARGAASRVCERRRTRGALSSCAPGGLLHVVNGGSVARPSCLVPMTTVPAVRFRRVSPLADLPRTRPSRVYQPSRLRGRARRPFGRAREAVRRHSRAGMASGSLNRGRPAHRRQRTEGPRRSGDTARIPSHRRLAAAHCTRPKESHASGKKAYDPGRSRPVRGGPRRRVRTRGFAGPGVRFVGTAHDRPRSRRQGSRRRRSGPAGEGQQPADQQDGGGLGPPSGLGRRHHAQEGRLRRTFRSARAAPAPSRPPTLVSVHSNSTGAKALGTMTIYRTAASAQARREHHAGARRPSRRTGTSATAPTSADSRSCAAPACRASSSSCCPSPLAPRTRR